MVPDNDYIAKDLLLTDDVIAGKAKLENMVWVIFENGLGPVKEEVRIDLPLFLATSRVYYAGIALPRLRPRDVAYPCLIVETDAGTYQTKQVADMERVIQTEFQKDFRGILTRAIASAVLKAVAQAVAPATMTTTAILAAAWWPLTAPPPPPPTSESGPHCRRISRSPDAPSPRTANSKFPPPAAHHLK